MTRSITFFRNIVFGFQLRGMDVQQRLLEERERRHEQRVLRFYRDADVIMRGSSCFVLGLWDFGRGMSMSAGEKEEKTSRRKLSILVVGLQRRIDEQKRRGKERQGVCPDFYNKLLSTRRASLHAEIVGAFFYGKTGSRFYKVESVCSLL